MLPDNDTPERNVRAKGSRLLRTFTLTNLSFWLLPLLALVTLLACRIIKSLYGQPDGIENCFFLRSTNVCKILALLTIAAALLGWWRRWEWRLSVKDQLVTLLFGFAAYHLFCKTGWMSNWGAVVPVLSLAGTLALMRGLLGRWAWVFWVPVLTWLGLETACSELYETGFNALFWMVVLDCTPEEFQTYATLPNVLGVLAIMALAAVLCLAHQRFTARAPRFGWVLIGLATLTLTSMATRAVHRLLGVDTPFIPIATLCVHTSDIMKAEHLLEDGYNRYLEQLPDSSSQPSCSELLKEARGIVFVLHIGESVKASHLSLNGYGRKTTPWLDDQDRVFSFTNWIAPACSTTLAHVTLLTDAEGVNPSTYLPEGGSCGPLTDLLMAQDFRLHALLPQKESMNNFVEHEGTVFRALAHATQVHYATSPEAWDDIATLREILGAMPPEQNLMLFVYNNGSHTPFQYYDRENPPFAPAEPYSNSHDMDGDKVRNAYDSTIHYLDEYVRRMCEELRGRPFVYIYVSDHGECVGDNGYWTRGCFMDGSVDFLSDEASRVGAFVVYSEELERLHPHFAEAIKQMRAHAGKTLCHAHLFHTILGLFGIESPFYKPQWDLTRPDVSAYSGPHPPYMEPREKAAAAE